MEDTQIVNLERKINIDCESDCTEVYVDVRLDNEMFNLISRSIAGAGLSAGGQVSRTCCNSGPTCVVKIISHHSRPLILPALGQSQQGQTEAELQHDEKSGRL